MKPHVKKIVFMISMASFFLKSQNNDAGGKNKLADIFSTETLAIKIGLISRDFVHKSNWNVIRQPFAKKNLSLFDKTDVPLTRLFEQNQSCCMFTAEKPNLAFFCAMENKFRNRFNIYLKLRAGNDEVYRDLISTISSK